MKQPEYDVTIIGSGMGGMCAAALLSQWGYKTLVVESASHLGGRCSTVEVEGFKLATGAVALHRGGAIDDIYRETGAKLELVDMPRQWYRIGSIEGQNYEMPAKGAIAALLDITNNLEVSRAKLLGQMAKEVTVGKVMSVFRRGMQGQERAGDVTFHDWLSQYTRNELAHKTFDAMCCNLMSFHTYEIKASDMFALFGNLGRFSASGIAPNGNEANMRSLSTVIETNGNVWLNCPARQIMVKDRTAQGIVVHKDGEPMEITSKVVISNAGPKATVDLAGNGNFDKDYLSLIERIKPVGIIMAHIASDKPLCLANGKLGGLLLIGLRRLTAAFPLSNFSPHLAPRGEHLLYVVGFPPSYLKPIDIEDELEQTTLDLGQQFPEFEHSGRILKFEVVMQYLPEPGIHIPRTTPVKNLFNVGDGVQSPGSGGASSAAESAREVADIIKKQIRP